jgi:penicillin-binding protein 1C
MQLARQVLLRDDPHAQPSIRRKAREIALALQIAHRFTKDEILRHYVNRAPYGGRAIGIEAASSAYFGAPASNLSLSQAALLTGLLQAPARADPRDDPTLALARRQTVLDLMKRRGMINEDEAARAAAAPLELRPPATTVVAPHFVVGARERAVALAAQHGGNRVVTTLDAGLQQLAERTIARHLARLTKQEVTNAALVAIDPRSGEILALAGSADYFNPAIAGQVNVALSPRQPGSAIKPLTYAAAFERGVSPADVFFDVRTTFTTRRGETFIPVNYDHDFHGPMSLRTALGSSINVVAVQLLDQIGVTALVEIGHRLGLSTWRDVDRYDLALTLGGGEVTLLELTAAYSAFANGGLQHRPIDLLRIEAPSGRTLVEVEREPPRQVLAPEVAFLVTHVLSDPKARELAFGMDNPLTLSRPAAVKTGTTSRFRDNWTIGYTPQFVVGVWVGNSDGRPMREVSGISGAAPIWRDFVSEALRGQPALPFPVPAGITWATVCALDGKLATPDCPRVVLEPFLAGQAPTEPSTSYQRVPIDLATGRRWEPGCRGPMVERLFWMVPPPARAWAEERGIPLPPTERCLGGPATASASLVRLVAPDDRAEFVISRRLPETMQRVRVRAAADGGVVLLTVNDEPIAPPGVTEGWWTLRPGEHLVRAILIRDGNVLAIDERRIRVEDRQGGHEP